MRFDGRTRYELNQMSCTRNCTPFLAFFVVLGVPLDSNREKSGDQEPDINPTRFPSSLSSSLSFCVCCFRQAQLLGTGSDFFFLPRCCQSYFVFLFCVSFLRPFPFRGYRLLFYPVFPQFPVSRSFLFPAASSPFPFLFFLLLPFLYRSCAVHSTHPTRSESAQRSIRKRYIQHKGTLNALAPPPPPHPL